MKNAQKLLYILCVHKSSVVNKQTNKGSSEWKHTLMSSSFIFSGCSFRASNISFRRSFSAKDSLSLGRFEACLILSSMIQSKVVNSWCMWRRLDERSHVSNIGSIRYKGWKTCMEDTAISRGPLAFSAIDCSEIKVWESVISKWTRKCFYIVHSSLLLHTKECFPQKIQSPMVCQSLPIYTAVVHIAYSCDQLLTDCITWFKGTGPVECSFHDLCFPSFDFAIKSIIISYIQAIR